MEITSQKLVNRKQTAFAIINHRMELERKRLSGILTNLHAYNPDRVLERGYAVVTTADGKIVRFADSVALDDKLSVKLAKGKVSVMVYKKEK